MNKFQSFQTYVKEELSRGVVLFWGRCNPPTIGHEAVFNFGANLANKNSWPFRIYVTHTKDNKKNPLGYDDKLGLMREIFPRYKKYIVECDLRNITAVLKSLQDSFTNVILVTGADRVEYFQNIFDKYNGKDYYFTSLKAVSSGSRDPEVEGVEGMSASKLRGFAEVNDFEGFQTGFPANTPQSTIIRAYNLVRSGLGLQKPEEIQLERTQAREKFYTNKLVKPGDFVATKTIECALVESLGPNFILLSIGDEKKKVWPSDITQVLPDPGV